MLPEAFAVIGSDHHLDQHEVEARVGDHPHTAEMWQLYQDAFDGFCETQLDPLGHRLTLPVYATGRLVLDTTDSILVVGTGPSLLPALPALRRYRRRVQLWTSPRGASLLARHRLMPDLVIVEHRTALDAHHAARARLDGQLDALATAPLVAVDWRTPPSLIAGVDAERMFVPAPLPTWGLWPATALALALNAGATRVGVLGIDLGTAASPDPAHEPLRRLLELIARLSMAALLDCGEVGARKTGWPVRPIEAILSDRNTTPLGVVREAAPTPEERQQQARATLQQLSPTITRARMILAAAEHPRRTPAELVKLADEILSWRHDFSIRVCCQDTLGLSFLPRLWRLGIDRSLGPSLWRPLVLAMHELVGQADRIGSMVETRAA